MSSVVANEFVTIGTSILCLRITITSMHSRNSNIDGQVNSNFLSNYDGGDNARKQ